MHAGQPSIGFACLWEPVPQRTWSYTPWNLRAGMRQAGRVVDVGVQIPAMPRSLLRAAHLRYRRGRLVTTWAYSPLTDAYTARVLSRSVDEADCDIVLTIQDLAILPVPYITYQDLSYDALIAAEDGADRLAALLAVTPATIHRRRQRQLSIYARASHVIAMSEWFARTLTEQTGLPSSQVSVVHPGISARLPADRPGRAPSPRPGPRRRLLLVGQDFFRKGGDLVVKAVSQLRREFDPQLTLTVAGPKQWPLPGPVPKGVSFLGALSPQEVAQLYDHHDLFVMPSRMEPFGIVFAEAISRGLPCIARAAYAMPEIVTPGVTGALVTGDDIGELASTIVGALTNDELYVRCHAAAAEIAAHFSWERAGREMVSVITRTLRPES
jgi:glycosyltransferase involved in cell wall biosynthesis